MIRTQEWVYSSICGSECLMPSEYWTVHSPLFFRRIVELDGLPSWSNWEEYKMPVGGGGGGHGGRNK